MPEVDLSMAERVRETLTTERLNDRLARILAPMSKAADPLPSIDPR